MPRKGTKHVTYLETEFLSVTQIETERNSVTPLDRTPHKGVNLSYTNSKKWNVQRLTCFNSLAGPSETRPGVWIGQG